MRMVFRPAARREILEAQAWYEARARGLGFEFARAVEVAVEQVLRMPLAHPVLDGDFRHIFLRRFPYSIIYHVSESELVVVACFHHRRKPGDWQHR